MYLKSTAAARELGVPYHQLFSLIRAGKVRAPSKDSSGDYLWADDDIAAARQALAARRRMARTEPTHAR